MAGNNNEGVSKQTFDMIIQTMEKNVDALGHMLKDNNDNSQRLTEKVIRLESQLKEIRNDIYSINKIIDGDGNSQGLNIQVQLMNKDLEDSKARLERKSLERVESKIDEKKSSHALLITMISGGIAALVEIFKYLTT